MNFWHWFFKGIEGKPGFKCITNLWLIPHAIAAITISLLVQQQIKESSIAVLLPLSGALVGLSFAWAGNAQALLQTEEIELLSSYKEGGFADYVYTYQLAILVILITIVAWGIGGLGIFDDDIPLYRLLPTHQSTFIYFLVKFLLFFLASLSVRECWHVVLGAQLMLLARFTIRRSKQDKK